MCKLYSNNDFMYFTCSSMDNNTVCTYGIEENTRGQRVTKCAHFLVLNLKCVVNISNRSGKRHEVCKLKCFEAVCIL